MSKHNNHPQDSPIAYAFTSMCDRIDRLACLVTDPYRRVSQSQYDAVRKACEAIESEWILEPSMRSTWPGDGPQ